VLSAVVLAAVLATLITWRVSYVRRTAIGEYTRYLDGTLVRAASRMESWAAARRQQVAIVASVAGQEPELFARNANGLTRAARSRMGAVLGVLVGRNGITNAWLLDSLGHPVVLADDSLHKGAIAPITETAAGDSLSQQPHTESWSAGPSPVVDFVSPVRDDDGQLIGSAVLRVDPRTDLIDDLNPTMDPSPTARTSIVVARGDSVIVVASATNALAHDLPRIALRDTPPTIRSALGGTAAHGVGAALFGSSNAMVTAHPVPALSWSIVRQRDVGELLHDLRLPLIVESTTFSVLIILLVIAVPAVRRAARLRREQEVTRLRNDFVAGVSHELRTPLAQIRLFAQLLRKGTLHSAPDTDRALRIIDQEARRLTFLVDNVLDFARSERPAQRIAPVVTDVAAEACEALEAFEPLAEERGIELHEELQTGTYALVDPRALRQILLNFLDNAAKYGPRGQTISVGAVRTDGWVRLWVDDGGPGVPESERERIWRPFYRIAPDDSTVPGSGIGLAVVKELVAQHGGRVHVERAPAGGARFVAELPVADRPPTAALRVAPATVQRPPVHAT
jgi:signal transduction histidine kinase